MPGRDLPSTIKVISRRGSNKSRAESPLVDTRSAEKSGRTRGRGRDRERPRQEYERRSKSRDRQIYEPPEQGGHEASRRKHYEDDRDEGRRSLSRDRSRDQRRRHAFAEREREREREGDPEREREREREREKEKERKRNKERQSRRDRTRSERERPDRRRRRSRSRSRTRGDDDSAEHYRQFEELEAEAVQYSKMTAKKVEQVQEEIQDPFNLCAGSESFSDVEPMPPSRTHRVRRSDHLGNASFSSADGHLDKGTWSEERYQPRQDHSFASIAVTSLQLLILMLQLAMCGIAPLDVNPMVGPFPDAFSEWGGKNAYLMLREQEYWRLITPAFLHVGVLHLLANSFCLLYSSALFEREWGSWNWLFIFVVSEVGCVGVSCVADPDTIAVGSSGALMGLFAAKLAHVLTYTFFETYEISQDEGIHVDQLGSVLCGLTVVSLLSSFTYVDWSGHMGGLASGFFAGMLVFARPIKSCCFGLLWGFLGLAGIAGTAALVVYFLITETDPDEELADGCEYFRSLYPEGYECGCL
jgi:membrane associated rhomboid family serine protease